MQYQLQNFIVCNLVRVFIRTSTDAFRASVTGPNPGLEGHYAGSRLHICSFAAALVESNCIDTGRECVIIVNGRTKFPRSLELTTFAKPALLVLTFILSLEVHADDPLWDGEGCGPTSTCCQFNTPPWFCATPPQPTTDDIELKISWLVYVASHLQALSVSVEQLADLTTPPPSISWAQGYK